MTQFALILGIQVAALAYALVVGRSLLSRGSASPRLKRLGGALERATAAFHSSQLRAGLVGMGVGVLVLGTLGLGSKPEGRLAPIPMAIGSVLALILGAGLCFVAAFVAGRIGVRAGMRTPSVAAFGLDRVLGFSMRTAGVTSLLSEALASLGLCFVFGIAFLLLGGPALELGQALALGRDLMPILAGFALGAGIAFLVLQRSAATYQTASRIGGDATAHGRFGLQPEDPRNPSVVSDLSGLYLAESAGSSALGFVLSATSQVALLAIGLAAESGAPAGASSLVLLPFVVRAFFVLASGFGFSVVRTEEMKSPDAGILRGYATTLAIGLFGLTGSVFWMAREQFAVFFTAGALGAGASFLVGLTVFGSLSLVRREPSEAARFAGDPSLSGLGSAFQIGLVPLFLLGLTAAAAAELGARSGLAASGISVSLVTWAALLGLAPFALAASSISAIAEGARRVAALGGVDLDVQRRAARLSEARVVSESGRAQLTLAAAVTALLAALSIPALSQGVLRWDVGLLRPGVMLSAGLGAVLSLTYASSTAHAAARGAREIALEVERQLRGFSRESSGVAVPLDFSPSYKACIELSARFAFVRLAPSILVVLALPASVALLMHALSSPGQTASATEGLVSSLLCTGLVGFFAAFALDLGRVTCEKAGRSGRAEADIDSAQANIANLLVRSAGPAARGLVLASAAVALAVAPFI